MSFTDQAHLNAAHTLIHEALNQVCMVLDKDSVLVHTQNRLYALERTLFEYIDHKEVVNG